MDADLQDSPESVGRLIEPIAGGYAAVLARRGTAASPGMRRLSSRLFKAGVHALCGIPPDVGMFVAIDRRMRDALLAHRTRHVYIEGMIGLAGLPFTSLGVPRETRPRGGSSYTLRKRIRFAWSVVRGLAECTILERRRSPTLSQFIAAERFVALPTQDGRRRDIPLERRA